LEPEEHVSRVDGVVEGDVERGAVVDARGVLAVVVAERLTTRRNGAVEGVNRALAVWAGVHSGAPIRVRYVATIRDSVQREDQSNETNRVGHLVPVVRLQVLQEREEAVVVFAVMLRAQRDDGERVVITAEASVDEVRRRDVRGAAHHAALTFDGLALSG
jgi:hypothetical protein